MLSLFDKDQEQIETNTYLRNYDKPFFFSQLISYQKRTKLSSSLHITITSTPIPSFQMMQCNSSSAIRNANFPGLNSDKFISRGCGRLLFTVTMPTPKHKKYAFNLVLQSPFQHFIGSVQFCIVIILRVWVGEDRTETFILQPLTRTPLPTSSISQK